MSGGEWLIRQPSIDGRRTTERITIEYGIPQVKFASSYLSFTYTDGRELNYPWNNILRAEYRPHNEP